MANKDSFIERGRETLERALLVGVAPKGSSRGTAEEHLDELARLAETAGAEILGRMIQEREKISPATYVGRGKVSEIGEYVRAHKANLVIFDDDLSPAQARNVESEVGANVIDRTELILDIFARHARTRQSMLQVELAQLQYAVPRLKRLWDHLSRQDGGIGTRGPGETQLEVDRRRIRDRMTRLKKELREVEKIAGTQRKARSKQFNAVLVGYTNAGKSTLMNAMADAGVFVQDRLFATLDSVTRRIERKGGLDFLLTDTVGFIRKLPHHLVESFHATLTDIASADLLLHVVDGSREDYREQMEAVEAVLHDMNAQAIPSLLVFNKGDLHPEGISGLSRRMQRRYPGSITVSAINGMGVERLLRRIEEIVGRSHPLFEIEIPWKDNGLLSEVYRHANVLETLPAGEATHRLLARVPTWEEGWFARHPSIRLDRSAPLTP